MNNLSSYEPKYLISNYAALREHLGDGLRSAKCSQAIRAFCQHMTDAQAHWAVQMTQDETGIEKLQGHIRHLQEWAASHNLGADTAQIDSLLQMRASALAYVLPKHRLQQRLRRYQRYLEHISAELDQIVGDALVDKGAMHTVEAARSMRLLFDLLKSSDAKRLLPDERDAFLKNILETLTFFINSIQNSYFQRMLTRSDQRLSEWNQRLDDAMSPSVDDSAAIAALMHDYAQWLQVERQTNACPTVHLVLKAMRKILTPRAADPLLDGLRQELLQSVENLIGHPMTDPKAMINHFLTSLLKTDPSGAHVESYITDRLDAYYVGLKPSREECFLDAECILWISHRPKMFFENLKLTIASSKVMPSKWLHDFEKCDTQSHLIIDETIRDIKAGRPVSFSSYGRFSQVQKQRLLLEAVEADNASAINHLLIHGADPLQLDESLQWQKRQPTIFLFALQRENEEVLSTFLSHGIDIDALCCDETALTSTAKTTNERRLHLILRLGANTEVTNTAKNTPLNIAAKTGNVRIIRRLLEAGADMNHEGDNHESPLYSAVWQANHYAIMALMDAGALTGFKSELGWTYLKSYLHRNPAFAAIHGISRHPRCKEMSAAISLSHSLKFESVVAFSGGSLRLEGSAAPFTCGEMLSAFQMFVKENPDRFQCDESSLLETLLLNGADDQIAHRPSEEILEAIRAGKVVQIHSGFMGHAVEIVFLNDDYFIINNKGFESRGRPGEVYKIDKNKLTKEMIAHIQSLKHLPRDNYLAWLKNFPPMVNCTSNRFTKLIEKAYPFDNEQQVGNCAWESVETSIFFTLAMHRFLTRGWKNPSAAQIKEVQDTFIHWVTYTQLFLMQKYFKQIKAKQLPFNEKLAKIGMEKIRSHHWPGMSDRVQALEAQYKAALDRMLLKVSSEGAVDDRPVA